MHSVAPWLKNASRPVKKRKLLPNHPLTSRRIDATFASNASYLESNVYRSTANGGVDSQRERRDRPWSATTRPGTARPSDRALPAWVGSLPRLSRRQSRARRRHLPGNLDPRDG